MVQTALREAEDSGARNWDFTQCFGDKNDIDNVTEGDVISAVEFDHTGEYLATGDCGGRVVLFKREEEQNSEYKFYTEFQSHDREFDYLKSLEIEEKINQIRWCRPQNNARYLLSTNDKTIKLWKVFEKSIKVVAENNGTDRLSSRSFADVPISQLRLPRMNLHDTIVATTPRRTYANAHAYHINSISVNSDNETFLSSDDLRINLWNLDVPNQSFNIVDIRPASMEELTEVITAMECHPTQCNEFIYSTCKGNVRMADMRERALCDNYAKIYEDPGDPLEDSFFTEITSSISDIKYARNGRYIIARDFMTVKIWDVAMERQPVKTIQVHENIRHMLCASYETESIFDKFEVEVSGDSQSIMTGSYSNNFFIYPHAINGGGTTSSPKSLSPSSAAAAAAAAAGSGSSGRTAASERDADEDAMVVDTETRPSARSDTRSSRARDRRSRRSRRGIVQPFAMDGAGIDSAVADYEMMDEDDEDAEGSEQEVISLTADKNVFRKRSNAHEDHARGAGGRASRLRMSRRNSTKVDFRKNILHLSWHPYENTVAIAATNNLFVFNAPHI